MLLAAVAVTVAVEGALPASDLQQLIVSVLLGIDLLLAARVAKVERRLMLLAAGLAGAGVAVNLLRWIGEAAGDGEVRVLNAAVVLFGPPAIAVGLVRTLRASRSVQIEAVSGVLSLYMLIGLLFAFVFGAVDRLGGDPFFAEGTPATMARCLYFSFTTLTTVGYGDLTARSDLGHTLCVFEALTGQIYLVTVVSLIVGNLRRRDPVLPGAD
jgi:Ion channel